MKNRSVNLALPFLAAALSLFSCGKNEDTPATAVEKPTLTINEVGVKNSKLAYPGQDLHIDADIAAPGGIRNIKLQITLAHTDYGWDFAKTYADGYAGAKNASFHIHVGVPEDARPGTYTLLLIVTEGQGQRTQQKTAFEVKRDPALPVINGLSLATTASVLHLSGRITAANKVEKIAVEVQSSAWTQMFENTDPAMAGQTSFDLDWPIDISEAPAGHYHVNITLTDQTGKQMGYHEHFDKN